MEGHIFGGYLSKLMVEKNFTLRELSRRSGIDPSNLSKIERGVAFPPEKAETLERLAVSLELNKEEHQLFFDYASLSRGQIPKDIESVKQNAYFPMLLRAIENQELSEEQTRRLTAMIADENTWQGELSS